MILDSRPRLQMERTAALNSTYLRGRIHGIFGCHFRNLTRSGTLGGSASFPFRLILAAPGSGQSHKRSN